MDDRDHEAKRFDQRWRRVIRVRQNSTNEKRGVFEKKVERGKKESHLEICAFKCREKAFFLLFLK